jgi:hypothetical protein
LDLKHDAHFGSSTLKPLTPVNRILGQVKKGGVTSPGRRLMHSSTVTSSSSRAQKSDVKYSMANSSTNAPRKNQINDKENLAKRTLKFKTVNNNVFVVNSPNQSPCVSSPLSKKRVYLA